MNRSKPIIPLRKKEKKKKMVKERNEVERELNG